VPTVASASTGHAALEPEQVSATSHRPAAARQTNVPGRRTSPGHAALLPVHVSATSQVPALARQTVVEGEKPSAGQTPALHDSATSHAPADARHKVPFGWGWQARAPLQKPVMQGEPMHSLSGSVPVETAAHVPFAAPVFAAEHASQLPAHTVLQQKPSTHEPL
jgi:hypothetical protein